MTFEPTNHEDPGADTVFADEAHADTVSDLIAVFAVPVVRTDGAAAAVTAATSTVEIDPTSTLDETLIAAANAGALRTTESRPEPAAIPTTDELAEAMVEAGLTAQIDTNLVDLIADEAERDMQTRIWTALIVGVPGDRTMLIVDWLMLACRTHGMIARAIPLGSTRGGLHGMFIEMAATGDGDAEQAL
ncbi:MAG: hypothetical protein H7123_05625, partial [Thermoleophilia bacterium]|nr:hypothetical protein [Thermoleophilia bacterium]